MPTPLSEQIAQLEIAVAALEVQRSTLGDATVDTSVATLRAQLETLRLQASATTGIPIERIEEQLEHLRQADLIVLFTSEPELAYIFKHALTQQAEYDSMLHAVRREIHRNVAETIQHQRASQDQRRERDPCADRRRQVAQAKQQSHGDIGDPDCGCQRAWVRHAPRAEIIAHPYQQAHQEKASLDFFLNTPIECR